MKIDEIFKIAINSILSNKVRAFLTMLGIIIGISAVIALLSLGQGAQSSILEEVQGLGSNTITIIPVQNFGNLSQGRSSIGTAARSTLDKSVKQLFENEVAFPEIINVSPSINSSYGVTYGSKNENYSVSGIDTNYFMIRTIDLSSGKRINENDVARNAKVANVGFAVAKKFFGESDPINKIIKINDVSFRVKGVFEEKDSETDSSILVPITADSLYLSGSNDFSRIVLQIENPDLIDNTAGKVEDKLLTFFRERDIEKAQFTVFTSKDIISITSTITGVFTTLLSSIAGISLLVGGIGIMNIMLVSVTERTREIGLRKAVGARPSIILLQFVAEAIILTVIGGIIGIILGLFLAFVVGSLGNIPVILSLESISLSVGVSAAIGLIFGFYPAYRAAKLNPIDALRYE